MEIKNYDFEQSIQGARAAYEDLRKQVEELKAWNKDKEIQRLQMELARVRDHSLLNLSDKEIESLKQFRQLHYETCGNPNKFTYHICGSGIGSIIEVECDKCGTCSDITDISSW